MSQLQIIGIPGHEGKGMDEKDLSAARNTGGRLPGADKGADDEAAIVPWLMSPVQGRAMTEAQRSLRRPR